MKIQKITQKSVTKKGQKMQLKNRNHDRKNNTKCDKKYDFRWAKNTQKRMKNRH